MHQNKVQSEQHRIYVVHPHPGATSTNSSSLLSSVNQLQAQSLKTLTPHRIQDPHNSLDPSSLCYNTKPSTISHRDFHFALQVLHKMQKCLITRIQLLALILHHIDISSTTSLYGLDIYIYIQNRPKHG